MTTLNTSAAQTPFLDPRHGSAAGSTGVVLQETYTLGTRIGQGGMGEVYEASHVRLPGRFAVKILRPDLLTNREAVSRFCREAELMSELRHPHIVQIFDFNASVDGLPYFVMEYLDGIDLQTRLTASGALPLSEVVPIVEAVASALGAAHAMGVVHRDLKPANIFLIHGEGQDDDFVKVIDFGISLTASSGPGLSKASEILGTPAFMSPEQALGRVGEIDGRTDQFALAGITTLMLTGRAPFAGDDPASLLYQVVHEDPVRLSSILPDTTGIQAGIQAVLDRGLAKRREDRFDSGAAFASALAVAARAALDPLAPSAVVPVPRGELYEDDAPPPPRRPGARLPESEPVRTPGKAKFPRSIDRVPHGPQRAFLLGLAVLGLAGVIAHKGWYEGFPRRAATLAHDLVGELQGDWRLVRGSVAAPIPDATREAQTTSSRPPSTLPSLSSSESVAAP